MFFIKKKFCVYFFRNHTSPKIYKKILETVKPTCQTSPWGPPANKNGFYFKRGRPRPKPISTVSIIFIPNQAHNIS